MKLYSEKQLKDPSLIPIKEQHNKISELPAVDLKSLVLHANATTKPGEELSKGLIASTFLEVRGVKGGLNLCEKHENVQSLLNSALHMYIESLLDGRRVGALDFLTRARLCDRFFIEIIGILRNPIHRTADLMQPIFFLICSTYSMRMHLGLPLTRTKWSFPEVVSLSRFYTSLPGWEFSVLKPHIGTLSFDLNGTGFLIIKSGRSTVAKYNPPIQCDITYPLLHEDCTSPWSDSSVLPSATTKLLTTWLMNDLAKIWPCGEITVRESVQYYAGIGVSDPVRWRSSSSLTMPGFIFATLTRTDQLLSLECLVHEAMHQRLYLIERLVSLTLHEYPIYHHAWRADKRPIRGVLYASHAFYAVEKLYSAFIGGVIKPSKELEWQYSKLRSDLDSTIETLLNSNALTPIGIELANLFIEDREKQRR